MHVVADARRQHGDAGREHPERAAERDRRVALEITDVDRLVGRDVVEGGVAEALERPGREPAAAATSSNSLGGGVSVLMR